MPIERVLDAAGGSSRESARAALLELVGPCLAVDADGTITAANGPAGELLGVAATHIVGMPIRSFVSRARIRTFLRRLDVLTAQRNGHATFVTRLERVDGIPFDAEVRAATLDTAEGGRVLILGIRDVTREVLTEGRLWELNTLLEERIAEQTAERELLSDELERRRAYLETIVQHIPAGLVIADAETGGVTMVNERSREIASMFDDEPPTTRATRTAAKGARPDGTPYTLDELPLARALEGEEVLHERMILDQAEGRRKALEVNAAPVRDSSGRVVAAVALFQDVTEADARLRAAAEFVANAAHELRTPLAAIVSGIDVLEAGAKEIPEERDRFLRHVARESARLARLSGALLQLARVQSGVERPRTEIIQLAPVLASVAAGLRPAEGVRIEVRCASQAAAIGSRGLLEQALTSVAGNAAQYTDAGRIGLSVARSNGRVRIRVRDTGRGMAPETVARAGERFYRGDSAGPAGFGLGLAIARESVEAMGGSLVIASELGEGTTADILLPAAEMVGS